MDPPFNLGKFYTRSAALDSMTEPKYVEFLSAIIDASVAAVKQGGSLFLYHIPKWAILAAARLSQSMQFRHWIAVAIKNGFARGRRLYPAHYALLYFTKGEPTTFERPRIPPEECRHCGEFIKDYGGYLDIILKNGVNLSDVWTDISPVRHAKYKTRAANELPSTFTDRVLNIAGRKDGLFVDPFGGSGAAVVSAKHAQMRFSACDISKRNCALMASRLADAPI